MHKINSLCQHCNIALSLTLAAPISKCFWRLWFMLNNSYYSYFFVEKILLFPTLLSKKLLLFSYFLVSGCWKACNNNSIRWRRRNAYYAQWRVNVVIIVYTTVSINVRWGWVVSNISNNVRWGWVGGRCYYLAMHSDIPNLCLGIQIVSCISALHTWQTRLFNSDT